MSLGMSFLAKARGEGSFMGRSMGFGMAILMMSMLVMLAGIAPAGCSSTSQGQEGEEVDLVFNLTTSNYPTELSRGFWFVEFFAPWCGHCKKFAPDWKKLGVALKDVADLTVARVDCVADDDLCDLYDVDSFPTLKMIRNGGASVIDYRGSRTVRAMTDWAINTARPALTLMSSRAEAKMYMHSQGWPVTFVYFSSSASTGGTKGVVEAVAEKYISSTRVLLIEDEKIAKEGFGITTLPSLTAFHFGRPRAHLVDAQVSDLNLVDAFFEHHRLPFFDAIRSNNSDDYLYELATRPVVLAVYHSDVDEQEEYEANERFIALVKGIAESQDPSSPLPFTFGHLDGDFFRNFVTEILNEGVKKSRSSTASTSNLNLNLNRRRLVIYDPRTEEYFESSSLSFDLPLDSFSDESSIRRFIQAIADNRPDDFPETLKKGPGRHFLAKIRRTFYLGLKAFRMDWKTRKGMLLSVFFLCTMLTTTSVFFCFHSSKRKPSSSSKPARPQSREKLD